MPIYEYRCRNGHNFEVIQSMMDDPVTTCEQCAAPVERVFHPIAVHFKGSGFYATDYAKKGAKGGSEDGGKPESKKDSGGSGSDAKSSEKGSSGSKPDKASKGSGSAD